ncbi:MAG TPA: drug/metabolite exporter YedA [Thermoanaerobaculia bacterium]|nr:drug/metabolite exporter YedA [Thermoanaerobaculia bacterium]
MPEGTASRGRILLAFAAVYVLWGSTYLAIRFGVETVPPFFLAGARHLTAGLLLYLWMRLRGAARPEAVHWRSAAIVGGLMLFGGNGLVTWAEKRVPSGLAALIVASVPIWMAALEGFERRRRPGTAVIVGLLLGLAGIALLVAPGKFGGNGRVDPLGAAALLLASLCWSAGSLYSRRAKLPSSILTAIAMEMIAGGVWLFSAGLISGEARALHLAAISTKSALSLGYLVIFGSLIGFTAYVWLLKVVSPARVSTYAYVNPIVAVILGSLLAGEAITLRIAIAALVIVSAVALIITARSKPARLKAVEAIPHPEIPRESAGSAGG